MLWNQREVPIDGSPHWAISATGWSGKPRNVRPFATNSSAAPQPSRIADAALPRSPLSKVINVRCPTVANAARKESAQSFDAG